jgi:excisionase family DNA binding protein
MSAEVEYLTTRELAELLRVKERKVYELASSGELPCTRATGKLLFPRREVQTWLERHRAGGAAGTQVRPNVVVGSHDPLLDWALRESHSGLAAFLDGSLDGLARMARGEAVASGLHLPEGGPQEWNRRHLTEAMPGAPVVLTEWAWREQGLILASGNPLGIRGLADLRGRRFASRQPEAGTYVLLGRLLAAAEMSSADLELLAPPARTQTDVALAVAQGTADAGLGLACVARQLKLHFLPLARERYDLAVWRRAWFEPKAAELGGYDVSGFGRVHYNGP